MTIYREIYVSVWDNEYQLLCSQVRDWAACLDEESALFGRRPVVGAKTRRGVNLTPTFLLNDLLDRVDTIDRVPSRKWWNRVAA